MKPYVDVPSMLIRQLGIVQIDLGPPSGVEVSDVSRDTLAESGVGREVVDIAARMSGRLEQ